MKSPEETPILLKMNQYYNRPGAGEFSNAIHGRQFICLTGTYLETEATKRHDVHEADAPNLYFVKVSGLPTFETLNRHKS